eukprot:TRINITY_DN1407_c0_g1_i1.p1 TRINITY_DN1407_c0_g1~~TRINITY_DN1407_c0_g1_i1.p1  ORF type:complete len:722 (+),score=115.15 TRINITY_DN1407_c0_g1_i1:220-2385(+)
MSATWRLRPKTRRAFGLFTSPPYSYKNSLASRSDRATATAYAHYSLFHSLSCVAIDTTPISIVMLRLLLLTLAVALLQCDVHATPLVSGPHPPPNEPCHPSPSPSPSLSPSPQTKSSDPSRTEIRFMLKLLALPLLCRAIAIRADLYANRYPNRIRFLYAQLFTRVAAYGIVWLAGAALYIFGYINAKLDYGEAGLAVFVVICSFTFLSPGEFSHLRLIVCHIGVFIRLQAQNKQGVLRALRALLRLALDDKSSILFPFEQRFKLVIYSLENAHHRMLQVLLDITPESHTCSQNMYELLHQLPHFQSVPQSAHPLASTALASLVQLAAQNDYGDCYTFRTLIELVLFTVQRGERPLLDAILSADARDTDCQQKLLELKQRLPDFQSLPQAVQSLVSTALVSLAQLAAKNDYSDCHVFRTLVKLVLLSLQCGDQELLNAVLSVDARDTDCLPKLLELSQRLPHFQRVPPSMQKLVPTALASLVQLCVDNEYSDCHAFGSVIELVLFSMQLGDQQLLNTFLSAHVLTTEYVPKLLELQQRLPDVSDVAAASRARLAAIVKTVLECNSEAHACGAPAFHVQVELAMLYFRFGETNVASVMHELVFPRDLETEASWLCERAGELKCLRADGRDRSIVSSPVTPAADGAPSTTEEVLPLSCTGALPTSSRERHDELVVQFVTLAYGLIKCAQQGGSLFEMLMQRERDYVFERVREKYTELTEVKVV